MKPQRRVSFGHEGYQRHGQPTHDARDASARGEAMQAFLDGGGKVTRVKPVKGGDGPGFRSFTFNKKRGKK